MIYLDYSANTPADSRVLERFCEVERSCPGNANSRHQAGRPWPGAVGNPAAGGAAQPWVA